MYNRQSIITEIGMTSTLKMIAQAYEELSVMRMQKIRASVISNREFLARCSLVFYDVKISYKKQMLALIKKDPKKNKAVENSPKGTVSVFLSANNKLYGDIIIKIFRHFLETVKKDGENIIIVGRLGREMFEQKKLAMKYLYYDLPDSQVTIDDLKPIVFELAKYEKINIFYGRFENIIQQTAVSSNISGDAPFFDELSKTKDKERDYLFEPSVKRIFHFFETQVFTSLFKQTVHESQLARYASRIKAMEEALSHIATVGKNLHNEKKRIERILDNKKQGERLAGMRLWK